VAYQIPDSESHLVVSDDDLRGELCVFAAPDVGHLTALKAPVVVHGHGRLAAGADRPDGPVDEQGTQSSGGPSAGDSGWGARPAMPTPGGRSPPPLVDAIFPFARERPH
jgi:hypothetical protein